MQRSNFVWKFEPSTPPKSQLLQGVYLASLVKLLIKVRISRTVTLLGDTQYVSKQRFVKAHVAQYVEWLSHAAVSMTKMGKPFRFKI